MEASVIVTLLIVSQFIVAIWPSSGIRYIIYFAPVLVIFTALLIKRDRIIIDNVSLVCSGAYCITVCFTLAGQEQYNPLFWRDVVIITSYLSTFALWWSVSDGQIKALLIGLLACNILFYFFGTGTFIQGFDLLTSRGWIESGYAFPIGAITIYFLAKGNLFWSIISLGLTFVMFKRIALVAIAFAGLFAAAHSFIARVSLGPLRAATAVVGIGLTGLGLQFSAVIVYFAEKLIPGVSPEQLAMGRIKFAYLIARANEQANELSILFGRGPGSSEMVLRNFGSSDLLHNDFLKISYEYGAIGQWTILGILFIMLTRTSVGCFLYIYVMVLFLTDNTFIYSFHMLPVFLLVRASMNDISPTAFRPPGPTNKHHPRIGISVEDLGHILDRDTR